MEKPLTNKSLLDLASAAIVLATCVMVSAAAVRTWFDREAPPRAQLPVPSTPIQIGTSPAKGNPNAPVLIVEYADFECPFCIRFASEVLPRLERDFVATGIVQFVFKHLPLERIHPGALPAASAAHCAGESFWKVHDQLFLLGGRLAPADISKAVGDAGLSWQQVSSCGAAGVEAARRDASQAAQLGVSVTPAFLIGKRTSAGELSVDSTIEGAKAFEEFEKAIRQSAKRQ